jgi:hypothetical protein
VFGDTYLLGPNTVNSLRVTSNSSEIDKGYVPFFDAKSLGVRNITTPLPGFTAFTVSGGFSLGPTGAKPSAIHTTSFQIVDDVSLVRGAHQIGLGANYIHSGLSSSCSDGLRPSHRDRCMGLAVTCRTSASTRRTPGRSRRR